VKDKPKCRKRINELLKIYDCTLEDLWIYGYTFLSKGLQSEVKKMIKENGNPKKLTLTKNDCDISEKQYEFVKKIMQKISHKEK
jgi:hypothetical protein